MPDLKLTDVCESNTRDSTPVPACGRPHYHRLAAPSSPLGCRWGSNWLRVRAPDQMLFCTSGHALADGTDQHPGLALTTDTDLGRVRLPTTTIALKVYYLLPPLTVLETRRIWTTASWLREK